ncbi:MAG: amidophosphoribosyltransferase [Proteobacteria bacterium]|nr:amidophosphoribosyltransferase [Pseudomonadota bacterium]
MCGIIGVVTSGIPANQLIYDGLTMLQHRGQDAAGIATYNGGRIFLRKSNGLVRDVFQTHHMMNLPGTMGVGHVRYPTAGAESNAEAQPFYVNSPYGITLAHNGNLTNADTIKQELFEDDLRHINTGSDSEVILNVFAHELQRLGKLSVDASDIFEAIKRVHERCSGAYGVIVMIANVGLVAFRDPHGIRPICYGTRQVKNGPEFMVASESVAIDTSGFEFVRDIAPGEAVFISQNGDVEFQQCVKAKRYTPCIFEYVYFARPDSIIDGISVHKARMRMGEAIVKKIAKEWVGRDIDVVIPVPDTARTAAMEIANGLNVKYREGFIKNRYIPRTFLMPGQALRKKSVKQKLNAIELEFKGRNVLIVDDSIVRGTTSGQIIQMARDAGAKKVYFASAAPPVRYPNVYGIDMPNSAELIAHGRDVDEIGMLIGADDLIYQDIGDLVDAVGHHKNAPTTFEQSCFTGDYVTGDVSEEYLSSVSVLRSDEAKSTREASGDNF